MTVNDKNNLIPLLSTLESLSIELGCGANKRHANAVGIDALDYPCVNIVGDIYEVLAQFPSGSVDVVYSYHFVEHVENLNRLLAELSRIVKIGGYVEVVAPHFSNPYFYSDPTHRSFFGLYTFNYFSANSTFKRKVPTYQEKLNFKLDQVDLIFKSSPPFYLRHILKKTIGSFFNSCNYMKELYEENFCYLFPCFEVKYKLKRVDLDGL
jgi:ubiquinone/menaquinone biosynthesis C-methylase UbiE